MDKKIVFSIIMVVVVLAVIYLSQQAYTRAVGKTMILDATNKAGAYLSQGTNWAASKIYPKITGEVQAKGDMVNAAVGTAQKNVSENVAQKISNYFSGVANAVAHPGTPQNCPAQPATSSAK